MGRPRPSSVYSSITCCPVHCSPPPTRTTCYALLPAFYLLLTAYCLLLTTYLPLGVWPLQHLDRSVDRHALAPDADLR